MMGKVLGPSQHLSFACVQSRRRHIRLSAPRRRTTGGCAHYCKLSAAEAVASADSDLVRVRHDKAIGGDADSNGIESKVPHLFLLKPSLVSWQTAWHRPAARGVASWLSP